MSQDLDRPPLDQERLWRDLRHGFWSSVSVVERASSTQELALSRTGNAVVIAEFQSSGRGRRDRVWVSPPRAGITMSMLFSDVEPTPWLGVMVSIAAIDAVNNLAGVNASLKWPNDLMINERKFGGVISEVHGGHVVVGIGINVSTTREELPVDSATSLHLEGAVLDRESLVKDILHNIRLPLDEHLESQYRQRLSTLGRQVRIITSTGECEGVATSIESDGRLRLDSGLTFGIGDVIHVR